MLKRGAVKRGVCRREQRGRDNVRRRCLTRALTGQQTWRLFQESPKVPSRAERIRFHPRAAFVKTDLQRFAQRVGLPKRSEYLGQVKWQYIKASRR